MNLSSSSAGKEKVTQTADMEDNELMNVSFKSYLFFISLSSVYLITFG